MRIRPFQNALLPCQCDLQASAFSKFEAGRSEGDPKCFPDTGENDEEIGRR